MTNRYDESNSDRIITRKSGISRRAVLRVAGVGLLASMNPWLAGPLIAAEDRYANLQTEKYLGTAEIAATVQHEKIFTEGPVADVEGDIYFTNVPANHILKYTVKDRTLKVARENTNAANGLAFYPQGGMKKLLACEGGTDDDGRLTQTDLNTGEVKVLADNYQGRALGAPNDLCVDSRGFIYFTSRSVKETSNVNSVYRMDRKGALTQILKTPDIDMPNGVEVSPDDEYLYLVESDGRAGKSRCIRRYELQPDGAVKNGMVLTDFSPGRSGDGLCLDSAGNLYIAAGLHKTRGTSETLDTKPGIHVFTPDGKLVGYAPTPEDTITNCTFGGPDRRTLFVTCGKHLLQIPAKIGGTAMK